MECKIIVVAGSGVADTLNLNEDTVFESKQALIDVLNIAARTSVNNQVVSNIPGVTKMIANRVSNVNAGIQQDATHSTENSNVILPSQMFNAFTFKGYSQREVNEIYGAIADIAVKGLSDTFFRSDRPISEITAELVASGMSEVEAANEAKRQKSGEEIDFSELVASIVESDDKAAKTEMLQAYREILIEKGATGEEFGLMEVLTTTFDALDIPIDNAHLFKSAVGALANKFTKAAIKIKFDGQFAVLKPGGGSQQVYEITGGRMPYKSGMDVAYRDVIGTEVVTRDRAREWAVVNGVDINAMKPRNLQGQYVTIVDSSGSRQQLSMASGDQLIPEARALAEAKVLINKYKDLAEASDDYEGLYKKFAKEYKSLSADSDIVKFVNRYLDDISDDKLRKTFNKGDVIEKIFTHLNPEAVYFSANGKGKEVGDRAKLLFLGKVNTLGKVLTSELNRFMSEASDGLIPQSLHSIEGAISNESGHRIEISRAEVIVDLTARDKYLIREGDDIGDVNEEFFFNRLLDKSGINTPYHGADRIIKSGPQRILFHVEVAPAKYDGDVNDQIDYDPITNSVNVYGTPEAGNANKLLFNLKGYTDPEVNGKPAPSVRIIDGNMHIFLNLDESAAKNRNRQAAIQGEGDSNYRRVENYLSQQYKIKAEDLSKISEETKQEQISKLTLKAKQMFNSWNKYLDVIGTRIPGQHYQSFQGLRIVGFATGNKIFVPNEITMLAGSDFDIDKMNMIYYSIERDGLLSGWHPSFNYDTTENLESSMRLPLPTNRNADSFSAEMVAGQTIDEAWSPDADFNVDNLQHLIGVYDMLKLGVKIDPTTERGRALITRLVTLDDTSKYKVTPKGVNNFTISRANTVINNPKNYLLLQKPVSMASPQLMGAMSKEGKDAKQRSKEQISSIVQGKIDNMIGRDMIGIVASTGLKSLSALTAVYNKSIMDLSDLNGKLERLNGIVPRDNADQIEIESKRADLNRQIGEITIGFPDNFSVANINYENASPGVLNLIKPRFTINTKEQLDIATQYIIQNMMEGLSDDAAEIESELLSAATDNAKELILGKIRAIPEFGTIYTALIAQGVPFWSIVRTMTSPATDFYMKHFDREPFKKNIINFDSALLLIERIDNKLNSDTSKSKVDDTLLKQLKTLKDLYGFTYKQGIVTDADGSSIELSKLKEFKSLLTQGKAVQILGKYLGINQGIKAKAFEIYSFTKTIEEYILDTFGLNFNFTKFLNSLNGDRVYANQMIQNSVPLDFDEDGSTGGPSFNLLYVLSKATNFEKQLQGFNVTNQMLRESTYKVNGSYAVTRSLEGFVIREGKPLNEEQFNEVQKFIDNSVLLRFFNEETKRNGDAKTRPVFYDGLNRIELTSVEGRNKFMAWVHDKFIPMVKNMPDFNDNEFVRDLTYETVRDTLYAEPVEIVRMTYDTTNALTDESRSKEDNYKYHLNQLQYAYDTDPSKPEVNNIFNVLFWYNTLVNKGGTGKYSWAKMQNDLIINSEDHPFKRLAELQGRLGKDTSVSYLNDGSGKRRISVNGISLDLDDLVTYHNVTGKSTRNNETVEDEAERLAGYGDNEIPPEDLFDDDSNSLNDSFFDEDGYDEQQDTPESDYVPLTRILRATRKGQIGTNVSLYEGDRLIKTTKLINPLISIPYDIDPTIEDDSDRIPPADSARALREIGSRFEVLNPDVVIKYQSKRELIELSNVRGRDFSRAKAFILDGAVTINLDRASVSDVIHEYAHLFLHSLKYESSEMYDNLIQMAVNDPQFNDIASNYSDLVDSDLNEEVFVSLFGKIIRDKITPDSGNKELILNFADFTKQKLKEILDRDISSVVELSAQEVANLSFEEAIDLMGDTVMKNRIDNLFDGPLGFAREIKRLKDDLFNNNLLTEECSG